MTPPTDRRLRRRRAVTGTAAGLAALVLAPTAAPAAELRVFRLPSEPLARALERFAIEARVSIGGLPAAGCTGWSRPVSGMMTAEAALSRLLPQGCRARRLDADSFLVVGEPAEPVQPPPRPAPPLEELVVTAERRAEPLIGAPFAASALSGAEIRRLGGRSFQDVVGQLAGVTSTNLGSGRDKIFIRGLSDGSFTGKTQSTVGLYLDDVPVTYDAPDPDLRLPDVERVEVLRGPQGTLYGSGSIGGIVRIVTARPDPSRIGAAVSVEGAATQDGAASSGLEAWLNLPLARGLGAVRGVAYRDERAGYIDNPRLGLRDVNYSRRSGGRLSALLDLPDQWTLLARFAHQSINTADTQYTLGSGTLARDAAVREPHDNDFTEFATTLTHAGAAAELKLSLAHIDHQLDTRYDATGAFPALDGSGLLAADESQSVRLWLAEAQLTSVTAGRARWLAGLFLSRADEADDGRLAPPAGGSSQLLYRRRDALTEAAAYGEISYDLTARLAVTAGGRLFADRLESRSDDPAQPGGQGFRGRRTDRGVAGKLRFAYAWAPDLLLYAQVQDGYRPGGFNDPALAALRGPGEVFTPIFRPDRLRSYEFGGEAPLLDRRLVLRAAVFHADWRDMQTDQYLASGLPFTVNVGDGSNTGLEAEAVWRPDARLQLRANLTLDDPQLTRTFAVFPAQPDVGLPGVPSQMGAVDVRYRRPIGGFQAELSAEAAYVGRSYLTFAGSPASVMGGYATARIQASLERGPWRAEAWIDNLTNQRANTFAFGNPFTLSRGPQATPLRPRTLGVALTRTF
jgi:outer membrane receptor protein involved in Fe transport